jgi:hypothetical protein
VATSKLRAVTQNIASSSKEANAIYNANAQTMQRARLLRPNEVAGDYDAGRLLQTTLGGYRHAITPEDLGVFKRNAELLGKQFRGGITARSVIDRSLEIDRERANREIHYAVPHRFVNGMLHIVTNAGPRSEVNRHHVLLELLNFNAAVSSPADGRELARQLSTGPLRVACDCGRWKYWYSYVATIGKFNASTPQLGFPKIRNPHLTGVSCKHVLRVMQQLQMPGIRDYIAKMIDNSRKNLQKPQTLTKKQAEEIAKQQQNSRDWKRTTIETSTQRRQRLAQQRVVQTVVARQRAAAPAKVTARTVATAKRQFEANARKLAGMGVITQAQLQAMLGKLG